MRNFKHIWIEIYRVNIYWVRCSWKEYIKLVKYEFDEKVTGREPGGRHQVFKKKEQDIHVIWLPLKASWDIIAHEVFHCVHWIMDDKGMTLTDSSEEAYAYLIQYIVNQIM